MKTSLLISIAASAALLWSAGCVHQVPPPPGSMAEYEQIQRTDPQAYARQVVLLHNVQRMLDADLKASDRVNSIQLVVHLGGEDAGIRGQMAGLLSDPRTPAEVHQAVLAFLLKRDYPDLAGNRLRLFATFPGTSPQPGTGCISGQGLY